MRRAVLFLAFLGFGSLCLVGLNGALAQSEVIRQNAIHVQNSGSEALTSEQRFVKEGAGGLG